MRNRALASVLSGRDTRLQQEGIPSLVQALALSPGDPTLLSDLSALYLLDAGANSRPFSLVLGLEAATQATTRPKAPTEAFHNRALLLEKLFCTEAAQAAWSDVLLRESRHYWIGEARTRLRALRRGDESPADDSLRRMAVRDRMWRELLPKLEAMNRVESAAALEELRAGNAILAESSGDSLLRDAIMQLERAFHGADEGVWRDLTKGHEHFERGYQAYKSGQLADATEELAAAARLLEKRGSPFRHWPRFYIACARQQEEENGASLEALKQLWQAIDIQPYWSLRGYMHWMEGQNRLQLGRPLEALDHFHQSLAFFARAGERDDQAAVHALVAECLLELGRQEDAWRELYEALHLGRGLPPSRRVLLIYDSAAGANLQYQRPQLALLFQDRAVAAARATANPKLTFLALLTRGLATAATNGDVARRDLREAEETVLQITEKSSRDRALADLAILESAVGPESRADGIKRLSSALGVYARQKFRAAYAVAAFEERARLQAAAGNLASAAADLTAALQLYQQRLPRPSMREARWSLHAGAQRAFDRLIALYLEMGQPSEAFSTAEWSRQLSLYSDDFRHLLGRSGERNLTIGDVQRGLGRHEVLVLFKRLESKVLIWIIGGERTRLVERPVAAAELHREVGDFVNRLRSGSSEEAIRAASRPLFDALFAEVLQATSPEDLLVLVPDRELFNFPAAAVYTPGGEPLGKVRTLVVAPSAEVYLQGSRGVAKAPPPDRPRRALVVSNPSFDARKWPSLSRLARAEAEGAAVSRLYADRVQLAGAAATRNQFFREAPHADVIHFAGHAIVNPRRPDLSVLLLTGSDGALYQHELYGLTLPRAPVVILAACDSASLAGNPGEGLSSLAQAFLSAGAAAVVGTLWPVDDATAATLMLDLHEGLQRGLSPEQALRQAQTKYLEGERRQGDPWGWAAFQVIAASRSPKETPDA